jgi:[heparan sulfate]-glucosamine 3-sulfotransferase 1
MELLRHLVVLVALLAAASVSGCHSQSKETLKEVRDVASAENDNTVQLGSIAEVSSEAGNEDEEDEIDETAEDEEEEDFDRICDTHMLPNRTRRLPDVVIIGAKKGGTRALIEFLKIHPRVKAAGPEIHFFDKHYENGVEWYQEKLPSVTETELATEKTPGYFHHPATPGRMSRTVPEAKLLLILRDPVKRLISDYNQFRSRHLNEGKTYPSLEELLFTAEGRIDVGYPPLQRSIYHHHMTRWFQHFSKEQIHIVHGESFIREPWKELQKVETFLGVEPHIGESHFFFNGTKGFYCAKDMRTTGVWECTRKKCLSSSKGRPKPPVQESTIAKLRGFYREHNKIFYGLVGQDFGWPEV